MTANELIAKLQALSPEERELPVGYTFPCYGDGGLEWDVRVLDEVIPEHDRIVLS